MADITNQEVEKTSNASPTNSEDVNKEENIPNAAEVTERGEVNNKDTDTNASAIGWDGDDDPENPMNWPESKKWGMVVVLSVITFLTSVALLSNDGNQVA
jgi:hypothetical protein